MLANHFSPSWLVKASLNIVQKISTGTKICALETLYCVFVGNKPCVLKRHRILGIQAPCASPCTSQIHPDPHSTKKHPLYWTFVDLGSSWAKDLSEEKISKFLRSVQKSMEICEYSGSVSLPNLPQPQTVTAPRLAARWTRSWVNSWSRGTGLQLREILMNCSFKSMPLQILSLRFCTGTELPRSSWKWSKSEVGFLEDVMMRFTFRISRLCSEEAIHLGRWHPQ